MDMASPALTSSPPCIDGTARGAVLPCRCTSLSAASVKQNV